MVLVRSLLVLGGSQSVCKVTLSKDTRANTRASARSRFVVLFASGSNLLSVIEVQILLIFIFVYITLVLYTK